MSAREKWSKIPWSAIVSALVAAAAAAMFVARSVAGERVAPVENRVTALEALRTADKAQLEKMDGKLDRLIELHMKPQQ